GRSRSSFKRANRPGGHFLQKWDPHLQCHHTQERALRAQNRGRKSNRLDPTLPCFLHLDVCHVESLGRTHSGKRGGTAIVASYQRGVCRCHDGTLNVQNRQHKVDRVTL